jgi:CPA1 family monovalent cation:H+ antiporter
MRRLDTVVVLLLAVIPLVALARRVHVPYPIVLVLGGLLLGFVPGLPPIRLPPDVVLVVFLPPLLYWEALTSSLGEMRAHAGLVRTLVVGLVLATMTSVALVAHAIVPHMPWSSAFVLGAIVAPTDTVAFAVVAKRLALPHGTAAIVEAESLLNDATALVFYAAAVAAAVSGTFVLRAVVVSFIVSSLAAVALGIVVGAFVRLTWRFVRDSDLQMAISVLAPFLAYLPAQRAGISGVLAVVAAGMVVSGVRRGTVAAETRARSVGFWETIAFLMNALIFVLVGLQLHPVLDALRTYSHVALLGMALAIAATVIAVRLAWLFAQRYVLRFPYRFSNDADEWKHRLVASWSGFRGGVSLAAALAIPTTLASGAAFPRRELSIFLTFAVIVVTLVGQGLTLPWLVARLGLSRGRDETDAVRRTMARIARAALARLADFERDERVSSDALAILRRRYEQRARGYEAAAAHPDAGLRDYGALAHELLVAQRDELAALRHGGKADEQIVAWVAAFLDLEELELDRLGAIEHT